MRIESAVGPTPLRNIPILASSASIAVTTLRHSLARSSSIRRPQEEVAIMTSAPMSRQALRARTIRIRSEGASARRRKAEIGRRSLTPRRDRLGNPGSSARLQDLRRPRGEIAEDAVGARSLEGDEALEHD